MSRGYDGPEIDDFRDSGWGSERANSSGDRTRGSATDWQTRTRVRLELQKAREAESNSARSNAQNPERSSDGLPSLSRERRQAATLKERGRSQYTDRDRTFALRPSEIHPLTAMGKFRVVGVDDLAAFAYNGDRERMQSELRNLVHQAFTDPSIFGPQRSKNAAGLGARRQSK